MLTKSILMMSAFAANAVAIPIGGRGKWKNSICIDRILIWFADNAVVNARDEEMVTFYIPDTGNPKIERDEDMVTFYIPDGGKTTFNERDENLVVFYIPDNGGDGGDDGDGSNGGSGGTRFKCPSDL